MPVLGLLVVSMVLEQVANAQDFTKDYWRETSAPTACKTQFTPLPPPKFVSKNDAKGKSVVLSDQYRETDDGSRYFSGNVKVKRDDLLLTAEHLDWFSEDTLQFKQGLSLYHDQGAMDIGSAEFDFESVDQSARLDDIEFVLFDIPLQGRVSHLEADEQTVEATQLRFSNCNPTAESWGFHVNRIRINRETSRVTFRSVRFQIGKLPILYVPFFTFRSDERGSGLNNMRFRYRSDNGAIIEQPFKFVGNAAQVTLAPRYLAKNGFQLGSDLRLFDMVATADWTPKDQKVDELATPEIEPSRWRVILTHDRHWGDWTSHIDFTQTSDFAYQHDFEFDSLSQPQFGTKNIASLGYANRDWHIGLVTQRFNSTSADELLGETYPEFDLEWRPVWQLLSLNSRVNAATYRIQGLKSHRAFIEQGIHLRIQPAWGDFSMRGSVNRSRIQIDEGTSTSQYDRTGDSLQLSAALYFDKRSDKNTTTIEPRLYYSRRSDDNEFAVAPFDTPIAPFNRTQIFGTSQVSGLNHIPGEHRLSIGGRVQVKPFKETTSQLVLDLANIEHVDGFDGRSARKRSWAMSLGVQNPNGFLVEHVQHRTNARSPLNEHNTFLVYEPGPRKSIYASLGRRIRDGVDQTEIGFRWPISSRWETVSAVNYDFENELVAEGHVGLIFNSCCYQTMLFFQRALDWDFVDGSYRIESEDRFMIRFTLTGLGGIGRNRIESLLDRKRFGFHTP